MRASPPIAAKAFRAAAFAAALLAAAPALADADGPDYFRVSGVRAGDVLNIRSAPAASAPKVGAIPHDGNGIKNLGCKGGLTFAQWEKATPAQRAAARFGRWCRIEFKGVTGWAAGWLLTEGSAP